MKKILFACLLFAVFACSKKENCLNTVENKIQPPFDPSTYDLTTAKESGRFKDCLTAIFSDQKLNTPLAFDPKYKVSLDYHKEDSALTYAGINHIKEYLFQINQTPEYSFYCLHLEAETEMEGSHYNILFTVDASGKLINQLLAHATGVMYVRDVIVSSATQFNISETTGREENDGPWYKADFKVDDNGKFVVERSETGTGSTEGESLGDADMEQEGGQSILTVSSVEQAEKELKTQIFTEEVPEEEFLEQIFFDKQGYLSVGLSDVADFVVIALYPSDAKNEDGSVNFVSNSTVIHAPANSAGHETAGAEVKKVSSQKLSDKEYQITLTLGYSLLMEGGKNQETEKEIQLVLTEEKLIQK